MGANSQRTADQKFANELDIEIYKLIIRTEGRTDTHWHKVSSALRTMRHLVRIRMHEKDRSDTI